MKLNPQICYNCGKEMHTADQYRWHDDFLGDFAIDCQPEEYSFCDCGEERLAYSLCLRIEQAEQGRISQGIMNMAHNNLRRLDELVVTSRDLESIMGISRQAISKNGKLKTLVYHITFKGKIFYLKKSVELFRKTGDGRFDLSPYINETTTTVNRSIMTDAKCVETASLLPDFIPYSTNNLSPQKAFENCWEECFDTRCLQSAVPMRQTSRHYTRVHANMNVNTPNTWMSYTDSLIASNASLALSKAQLIKKSLIRITNEGEK